MVSNVFGQRQQHKSGSWQQILSITPGKEYHHLTCIQQTEGLWLQTTFELFNQHELRQ